MRMVEEKVTVLPEVWGTADHTVFNPTERRLIVTDLKYGQGERVFAVDNKQLRIYGLGMLKKVGTLYDIDTVTLRIFQPRLDHVDEDTLTVAELLEFEQELIAAVAAAGRPDAPLVPGKAQCRWCKAKNDCKARTEYVMETVGSQFPNLDITDPIPQKKARKQIVTDSTDRLNNEEVARYLQAVELVRDWCTSLEGYALFLLEQGHEVPGFKLVRGKSNRAWGAEEDAVKKALRSVKLKVDQYMPRSLVSVAQAEKLVGGKKAFAVDKFQKLVTKPEGKKTIAPVTDPRPAISTAPAGGFQDLSYLD